MAYLAVTAPDGRMLGLYTSGVDAWQRARDGEEPEEAPAEDTADTPTSDEEE